MFTDILDEIFYLIGAKNNMIRNLHAYQDTLLSSFKCSHMFAARISCISVIFLMLLSLAFIPAYAQVTELAISPENPAAGEPITVTGKADPNEDISASVSFTKERPVSGGLYNYSIGKVTIPEGSDSFNLRAEGVQDLDVTVNVFGVPVTVPASVSGSVATFGTSKIKSGTYDITLSGNAASESPVSLSFKAAATIKADSDGNFEYTYTTDNMPMGDFDLNIGAESRTLTLGDGSYSDEPDNGGGSVPVDTSSSSSSSSGSSHTGSLPIVPAPETTQNSSTESDDGFGDDLESAPEDMNSPNDVDNSVGDSVDDAYVEGQLLEPEPSKLMDYLPVSDTLNVIVVLFAIGAIFIGYRRNRFK